MPVGLWYKSQSAAGCANSQGRSPGRIYEAIRILILQALTALTGAMLPPPIVISLGALMGVLTPVRGVYLPRNAAPAGPCK